MKLASYLVDGRKSYGVRVKGGIVDLGRRIGETYPDLRTLLEKDGLQLAGQFVSRAVDYQDKEVSFLPVIHNPGKIFCVGMNYPEKRSEFAESNPAPTVFIRFPDSQTGHNDAVIKPNETRELDYEGELAVVIGKKCYRVAADSALEYVAGYSCYMDGSVRDWQHSWFTAGKNWKKTGAFGPWLVTRDEINDPNALEIRTVLNGVEVQHDNTGSMIHSIPRLIEYISTFSELAPGDVIITGSPGGVGKKRNPPLFLQEGDVVDVEIEGIGCLHNYVSQALMLS